MFEEEEEEEEEKALIFFNVWNNHKQTDNNKGPRISFELFCGDPFGQGAPSGVVGNVVCDIFGIFNCYACVMPL